VAAAGNSGSTKREYPAAEESAGLIAVAATTEADTRATYSNYGSWVALGAPGDAIFSCVPGNYWSAWSGTSMAAPFVSGVVALVQSAEPQLAPELVIRRITFTAQQIGGDVRLRLDAAAALGAPPVPAAQPVLYLPLVRTGPR
jgi:subtilisin family serine protease